MGEGDGSGEYDSSRINTQRRNLLLGTAAGLSALSGCTDSVTVSFGDSTEAESTSTSTATPTETDVATTTESESDTTTQTTTETETATETDTETDTETATDTDTETATESDEAESDSNSDGGGDVAASIASFDPKSGTFSLGETQTADVTVENTGDSEHTFYVGYSVRTPSGDGIFNGAGPPEVTLSPGETGEVTTDFTVTEDSPNGTYGAFTTVRESWDGEDFGDTLDSAEESDVFDVEKDDYQPTGAGGVGDTGLAVVDHYWDYYDRRVYAVVENISSERIESGRVRCTVRYGDSQVSDFESATGTTYPGERYGVYFGIGRDYADNYTLYLKSSQNDEYVKATDRTVIPQ